MARIYAIARRTLSAFNFAKIYQETVDLATVSRCILIEHANQQEINMLSFYIPNMTCGGCAKSVTKALLSVDPQAGIEIDQPRHEVRVDSAANESAFRAALSEAGYPDKLDPVLKTEI